ncbi:MAG: Thermostable monoacylglycerol lipase [Candidatus Heimdallarchaeota archaeon AB_125]|nr:MAG: Thermostable monoacylglycerol lipase [Candidatus Heimdallarchaeota archaeon AB_125]
MSETSSTSFLLIHGFTGTHYEMNPLAEFLEKQGFSVDNITLPGHETSIDDLNKTNWTEWIDFAQTKLDKMKKKYENVYVCGLSMGGALTLLLGSRNRDLAGIIPLAAVYKVPDWRMYLIIGIPFLGLIYPKHKNEETGWEDLEALSTHKSYGYYPIRAIKQIYKLLREVKKSIHRIEVPILVVNSKNDPGIPLSFAEDIMKTVNSTDKTLVIINQGGHVIPKDAGRHQLFEEIEKWMEKRR